MLNCFITFCSSSWSPDANNKKLVVWDLTLHSLSCTLEIKWTKRNQNNRRMNCTSNLFCCALSSPQIMVKWLSFPPADMNFHSASSCLRRRWSPPSRGNTAASVTGSKWNYTGRGPPSRRSRRSLQSSSPSTSTRRPYWWAISALMIVSWHTSWFSGCFEALGSFGFNITRRRRVERRTRWHGHGTATLDRCP